MYNQSNSKGITVSDKLPLSLEVEKIDIKYYYSSPETKGNDFYNKMDSLADEIKELAAKIESKKNEMVELAKSNLTKETPAQDEFLGIIDIDGTWKIDGQVIELNEDYEDNLEEFYGERDDSFNEPIDKCDENNYWFISVDRRKLTTYNLNTENWSLIPNELRWEGNNTIKYFGEQLIEKDLGNKETAEIHFELTTRCVEFEAVDEWGDD